MIFWISNIFSTNNSMLPIFESPIPTHLTMPSVNLTRCHELEATPASQRKEWSENLKLDDQERSKASLYMYKDGVKLN